MKEEQVQWDQTLSGLELEMLEFGCYLTGSSEPWKGLTRYSKSLASQKLVGKIQKMFDFENQKGEAVLADYSCGMCW